MDTRSQSLVGKVVDGRYRVEQFIARGGMATVYRANDLRLDRTVALKVMHPSLAEDPAFVSRFEREARSAASLSHPSLVTVSDQGSHDGIVYLVMEYVSGCTLRDVLTREGRLTPAKALGIIEPVLEALTAAHRAGFAHRDIKPENVLIADDGRVKVADFGLARAIAASSQTGFTRGLLIGTVAYLAPEQVERGYADTRTDVYSCGILLYECLVGQPPFSGETPLSVAYQHVNATVPLPSSIRPEIPADVDELVAIATKQNPNARYADAADFVSHVPAVRAALGDQAPASKTIVLDRTDATITVGPWASATTTRNLTPPHTRTPTLTAAPPLPPPLVPLLPPTPGPPPIDSQPVSPPPVPSPDASGPPAPTGDGGGTLDPAPPIGKKPRKRRRFVRVLVGLLVLLLIGAGVGFGTWSWSKAQVVSMPSVVGLSTTEASAKLATMDLTMNVSGQDYSDTVPKGAVVSSDAAAGSQVHKGQSINVHTSAGPETIAIPKLVGLTQAKALARLAAARLVSSTSEDYSDSVEAGKVISAKPSSSTVVKIGSTVDLVVSKGPPPVKVPYLVGMSKANAIATLNQLGLKAVTTNQLPVVVLGRVYSQSVGSGNEVPRGTTITLTIV
ncbi:MAG: Stk1 family PASTA domain-containing Ser/Thr kinase [Actinomycetes bacterium]